MARRMERDRVREARPDIGDAQDVDEELAQLEDARSHRRDLGRQVGPSVASSARRATTGWWTANHRRARAGRRDDHVIAGERVDEPLDERDARRPGSRS